MNFIHVEKISEFYKTAGLGKPRHQSHIHEKLLEKAKEKLSTTNLVVSEIAYEWSFEHSQSFGKLFKSKVGKSPVEFRERFH